MRVIFDTNVLVSLSLGGGPTMERLGEAWRSGEVDLLVTEALLDEFAEVVARPHLITRYRTPELVGEFTRDLRTGGEWVAIAEPYPDAPDEGDRFLFALAREGRAEVLVTGDRALVELGQFEDTLILSPRAFAERLEAGS